MTAFNLLPCHIGVTVPDIKASIQWYEEMLGFKLVKQLSLVLPGKETSTQMAWIKNGDFYIEFFEDTEAPPFSMEAYRNRYQESFKFEEPLFPAGCVITNSSVFTLFP